MSWGLASSRRAPHETRRDPSARATLVGLAPRCQIGVGLQRPYEGCKLVFVERDRNHRDRKVGCHGNQH